MTEEQIKEIRLHLRAILNILAETNHIQTNRGLSKQVVCIETGQVYKSIRNAAKILNISAPSIVNCCKGYQDSANGLHFKYLN